MTEVEIDNEILIIKERVTNLRNWSEPLRVDNELNNGNSWRESHEKDQTALRPRI